MSLNEIQEDILSSFCDVYIHDFFHKIMASGEEQGGQNIALKMLFACLNEQPERYFTIATACFPQQDENSPVLCKYIMMINNIMHGHMNNELGETLTTTMRDRRIGGHPLSDEELSNALRERVTNELVTSYPHTAQLLLSSQRKPHSPFLASAL